MSDSVTAHRRWFGKVVLELPGRLRLGCVAALVVLVGDHAAKLGAAWAEPSPYLHNPAPIAYEWAMLVPALALLVPSRETAVLFGLLLGGGVSNATDVYLWPGGVPDFLPVGQWVANPADVVIFASAIALMAWPLWKLFQIARREYPERESDSHRPLAL